ncbi:hypothetical protein ACFYRG_34540 [Streptomyces mirabilis]
MVLEALVGLVGAQGVREAFLTLGCALICGRRLVAREAATRN